MEIILACGEEATRLRYDKVIPIHRAEKKMDMDKERDAKRDSGFMISKARGEGETTYTSGGRVSRGPSKLGQNLDIIC